MPPPCHASPLSLSTGRCGSPSSLSQAATITALRHMQSQLIRATHTISTMQGEIDSLSKTLAYYTNQNADTQQKIYDTEVRIKNTFRIANQDITTQLQDHETKLQDQLQALQSFKVSQNTFNTDIKKQLHSFKTPKVTQHTKSQSDSATAPPSVSPDATIAVPMANRYAALSDSTDPPAPAESISPRPARAALHSNKAAMSQHANRATQQQDSRSAPPQHANRAVTPQRDSRSAPPQHANRTVTPQQDCRSAAPQHANRAVTPQRDSRSAPPQHANRAVTPQRDSLSALPQRSKGAAMPPQDNQTAPPQRSNGTARLQSCEAADTGVSPRLMMLQQSVPLDCNALLLGDSIMRRVDETKMSTNGLLVRNLAVPDLTVGDLIDWLTSLLTSSHVQNVTFHVGINSCREGPVSVATWRRLISVHRRAFPQAALQAFSILPPFGQHPLKEAASRSTASLRRACQLEQITLIDHTPSFLSPAGAPKRAMYRPRDRIHPSRMGVRALALNIRFAPASQNGRSPLHLQLHHQYRHGLNEPGRQHTGHSPSQADQSMTAASDPTRMAQNRGPWHPTPPPYLDPTEFPTPTPRALDAPEVTSVLGQRASPAPCNRQQLSPDNVSAIQLLAKVLMPFIN